MSKDQLTKAQANSSSQKGGGGLGGMLAKKIIKQEPPKARSTIMTSHHEVLEVTPSATDGRPRDPGRTSRDEEEK